MEEEEKSVSLGEAHDGVGLEGDNGVEIDDLVCGQRKEHGGGGEESDDIGIIKGKGGRKGRACKGKQNKSSKPTKPSEPNKPETSKPTSRKPRGIEQITTTHVK